VEYEGGLTWVVDGDLQTGVKLPVSMLLKVVHLRGKMLVEIPTAAINSNDSDAKIIYSFLEGPELEVRSVFLVFLISLFLACQSSFLPLSFLFFHWRCCCCCAVERGGDVRWKAPASCWGHDRHGAGPSYQDVEQVAKQEGLA